MKIIHFQNHLDQYRHVQDPYQTELFISCQQRTNIHQILITTLIMNLRLLMLHKFAWHGKRSIGTTSSSNAWELPVEIPTQDVQHWSRNSSNNFKFFCKGTSRMSLMKMGGDTKFMLGWGSWHPSCFKSQNIEVMIKF